MVERYIDGKPTGTITPDNPEERARALEFIQRYNNHYGTKHKISFITI